jgi:hypothetical protein
VDNISSKVISAHGILEDEVCPFCASTNREDYNIIIDRGIIVGYSVAEDIQQYLGNDNGYYVCTDRL